MSNGEKTSKGGRWEEISHFNQVGSDLEERWKNEGKKKRENKRKKKKSGVRSSTLSLRSTEIRSSIFIRARDKVHLHDEGFA